MYIYKCIYMFMYMYIIYVCTNMHIFCNVMLFSSDHWRGRDTTMIIIIIMTLKLLL